MAKAAGAESSARMAAEASSPFLLSWFALA
jgi:hypothetical protein